jgi:hypothetical protein
MGLAMGLIENLARFSNISDLKSIEQSYWECIFSSVPGGAANGFVLGGIFREISSEDLNP